MNVAFSNICCRTPLCRCRLPWSLAITMQGNFGKPRLALVIQADQFSEHTSVTVLPVTSTLVAAPLLHITVEPSAENGLQKRSEEGRVGKECVSTCRAGG